jgi:hypothetical protein
MRRVRRLEPRIGQREHQRPEQDRHGENDFPDDLHLGDRHGMRDCHWKFFSPSPVRLRPAKPGFCEAWVFAAPQNDR